MITLSYLWLPYMILPMYAGLERLPNSLLEASADLGASTATTMRRIVLPVLFPAAVAGSIFAFSLTLGDYIAVKIVGGANQMLGNVVYDNFLTGNNMPFAAAVSTIPVVIMLVYLAAVRRTGALDEPDELLPRDPHAARVLQRLRARVHLRAAGARAAQLLQHLPHVRLAAAGPDHEVVVAGGIVAGARSAIIVSLEVAAIATDSSRWCSARWQPWRCSASSSSGATRSRC